MSGRRRSRRSSGARAPGTLSSTPTSTTSTPGWKSGATATRPCVTPGASTRATRTATASARCTSTRWRASGPCCAPGCGPTAASRRRSCRSTSPSSSSCTTPGAGVRPSSVNSSPPWWREVPTTPDPDKSVPRCVRGCPYLTAGVEQVGHIASDGSSPAVASPPPVREVCASRRSRRGGSGRPRLPRDGPHERGQLARDRGAGHGRLLAPRRERPVARRQPALRLPRDLADLGRHALELGELRLPHPWRVAVGPGALDQEVAHPGVAHLGDRAAPHRLPGGALARHQAEVAHQLARALEAADVADLDPERHRRDQVDAAQRLQRLDQRGEAPRPEELPGPPAQAREPLLREPHALDALPQHDLVGRVLEALRLQPAAVAGTPVLLAREEAAVPQEEGADLALLEADVLHRGRPRPHQVAHRLVRRVGDPDRRQLAGA